MAATESELTWSTCCIYALRDPDTNEIRYVGATTHGKSRMLQHLQLKTSKIERPLSDWLILLRQKGKEPRFEVLCKLTGPLQERLLLACERDAIKRLCWRHDLLNIQCNLRKIEERRRKWRSRMISYQGKTQCCAAWARELGISRERLRQRLDAYPLEKAMNPPSRRKAIA